MSSTQQETEGKAGTVVMVVMVVMVLKDTEVMSQCASYTSNVIYAIFRHTSLFTSGSDGGPGEDGGFCFFHRCDVEYHCPLSIQMNLLMLDEIICDDAIMPFIY